MNCLPKSRAKQRSVMRKFVKKFQNVLLCGNEHLHVHSRNKDNKALVFINFVHFDSKELQFEASVAAFGGRSANKFF
jgi:hypothetical protein